MDRFDEVGVLLAIVDTGSLGSTVTVTISASEGSLPSQLVAEILSDNTTPSKITASWALIENDKHLRLFDLNVDGSEIEGDVKLPIDRAGSIRVNLGRQQYLVFPN